MVWVAYLGLQCISVSLPQLSQSRFFLLSQVGKLLDFGLVKSVDDRVLALLDMYTFDLYSSQYIKEPIQA